ncbi:MAG: alpha/beta hydrolase [Bacteroidota bacterium]
MKLKLLIFFTAFTQVVFSQKAKDPVIPYSYCNWTNMSLNKLYLPTKNDTCLFVVSTRNYNGTINQFLDYDYDTTGTLKYFAVYFHGNQWTAVPHSSLAELLDQKELFKDFVIFTEGLGKTYTSGIDRATKMMRTYGVDELFFDWPTERPYMRPGKNIKTTCNVAPKVAIPYAQLLLQFQIYKNEHPAKFKTVTLFFHSMGNLLLMYDLKNDLFKQISLKLANSVVLNAACVGETNHREWLDKLVISENIYITINHGDKNLNGAKIIFLEHQLGERPKSDLSKKAQYINFSNVLEKEHNYFIIPSLLKEKPFLKQFYADVFAGKIPQLNYPDTLIQKKQRGN